MTAYCDMWKRGFDFEGRSSIGEYWKAVGCDIGITALLFLLIAIGNQLASVFYILLVAYSIVTIVPRWALAMRRLHDSNHSGWWMLLVFVPLACLVLLGFMCIDGTQGINDYGEEPWAV